MFTTQDFEHLRFLEGRWLGTAPNGSNFHEEYSFVGEGVMRSDRHADAAFNKSIDGSKVVLADGKVTSTWNDFTWQATEIVAGKACFEPINAPSSFCWTRISDDEVEVTQRWTDEQGAPQQYVVPLRRL